MKNKKKLSKLIRFGLMLSVFLGISFMLVFFSAPRSWRLEFRDVTGNTQMEKIASLVKIINERKENHDFLHLSFLTYDKDDDIWYFSLLVSSKSSEVFSQGSSSYAVFFKNIQDIFTKGSQVAIDSEGISLKVIFEDTKEFVYFTKRASAIRGIKENQPDLWLHVRVVQLGSSDQKEQQKEKENAIFINPNK